MCEIELKLGFVFNVEIQPTSFAVVMQPASFASVRLVIHDEIHGIFVELCGSDDHGGTANDWSGRVNHGSDVAIKPVRCDEVVQLQFSDGLVANGKPHNICPVYSADFNI